MAFVAPAGYEGPAMETSPRTRSNSSFVPSTTGVMGNVNAVAGPSTASSSRRTSKDDVPFGPSSAPPNPAVISVTHPPEFIHTHHPRRGSLTPLGLNVISPIPPVHMTYGATHPPHSPVRSVGFTPTQANQDAFPTNHYRRGSGASSSSTLTLSRPPQYGSASGSGSGQGYNRERRRSSLAPAYPAGFNPERRRSSLTPASPTRTHANGVISRPGSSDGAGAGAQGSPLHGRHHTTHGPRPLSSVRAQHAVAAGETRRGSMPQLHYGGWTGPRWNPSLPPQRGSVGEEAMLDEGFKFGSVSSARAATAAAADPTQPHISPTTPAAVAAKAVEISSSRRASRVKMDAFQEAEAAEADRQRRAFLAATYGEDGRRARERLSIGGPGAMGPTQTPSSPSTRRPSLMLWEKLGMAAAVKVVEPELAASSAPTLILPRPITDDDLGPRRGSLPIAIPGGSVGRSPSSHRSTQRFEDDLAPSDDAINELGHGRADDEDYEEDGADEYDDDRLAPRRPAPPLLPLSDPGPRLLPSTLALQRASHLLNTRRLQADPLPHPLPPSLHPPVPVDVTEFDIDFILAGSQAQLGRSKRSTAAGGPFGSDGPGASVPVDVIAPFAMSAPTPTLRLGGEDEDSFAKFVGKFDDEYGGRRGEWTFRARPPPMSPLEDKGPRAIWESPGAGAFELFANGDVRSAKNGTTWRVCRRGVCEYEIMSVNRDKGFFDRLQPSALQPGDGERYVLATKNVHCESSGWGVKLQSSTSLAPDQSQGGSGRPSLDRDRERERERSRPMKERLRVSISEATRAVRLDSTDTPSATTASAANTKLSSSLPQQSNLTPKKKRRGSRDEDTPASAAGGGSGGLPRLLRVKSRDPDERDRDKKDKDKDKDKGFFKRGIMASIKNTTFVAQYEEKKQQREERERERQQAHSWAGNTTHQGFIHPSGKNTPPYPERSTSVATAGSSSVRTSSSDDRGSGSAGGAARYESPVRLLPPGTTPGKAWSEVPDDAVAMVIPAVDDTTTTSGSPSVALGSESRQALLVWYVPFNGSVESDNTPRPSVSAAAGETQAGTSASPRETTPSSSSSLPKFQKLLRRRTSKDKDVLSRNSSQRSSDVEQQQPTPTRVPRHPLPFRSFRIVARIVDLEDLRPSSTSTTSDAASTTISASSPLKSSIGTGGGGTDDSHATSSLLSTGSTAPTSTILAGRTISTVIAVCHSRSQGVEFVLEGLDRLGYCSGESAWGPTGYEEWRGTGLSERGRDLLELLWAGCAGVMGLVA